MAPPRSAADGTKPSACRRNSRRWRRCLSLSIYYLLVTVRLGRPAPLGVCGRHVDRLPQMKRERRHSKCHWSLERRADDLADHADTPLRSTEARTGSGDLAGPPPRAADGATASSEASGITTA